jgi:integrase
VNNQEQAKPAKKAKSRKAKSRIYWRGQGGERRAYGDFRNMGGGQEALIPEGERRATTDAVVAEMLVAKRLAELQHEKTDAGRNAVAEVKPAAGLKAFVAEHLILKAKSGQFSESWLADSERMLALAVEFFGEATELKSITVADVQAWIASLARRDNGRGGTLGGGAIRHHINVLSNVYARAQSTGTVPPGYNPVASIMRGEKPKGKPKEANWLEVDDAARLLDAARTYKPKRADTALPFLYPWLATHLLTGGRPAEIRGLQVSDVNFERQTITFRPNEWRGLKTTTSHRTVPLWPQLAQTSAPTFGTRRLLAGCCSRQRMAAGWLRTSARHSTPWRRWRAGKRATCAPTPSGIPTRRPGCKRSTAGRLWRRSRWRESWVTVATRSSGESTGTLAPCAIAPTWSSFASTLRPRRAVTANSHRHHWRSLALASEPVS